MKTHSLPNESSRLQAWWRSLAALALAAAVAACGGGGGGIGGAVNAVEPAAPGANTVGPSAFTAGAISGFGSVIVNGVRFDDSLASIKEEDGDDSRELKLGMMVGVNSSAPSLGSTPRASSISFVSELKGAIDSRATSDSFVVLGVKVLITNTTVCDVPAAAGCASLKVGDVVEVYGSFAAATATAPATLTATRIELQTAPLFLKLRGAISNLNITAKTFNVGTQTATVTYAGIAAAVPATLANGLLVRVKVKAAKTPDGLYEAVRIKVPGERKVADSGEAKVEGRITVAIDAAKIFSVNGVQVDASNASLPAGGTASLVVGVQVEIEGKIVNGVLVATKVKLEEESEKPEGKNELHGTPTGLDTAAKTFMLRGVKVDYASATFVKVTLADFANPKLKIEVKGNLSADGSKVIAKVIKLDN